MLRQIADLAYRKMLSLSAIVEATVASFLAPDGADKRQAAFASRLDRLLHRVQRLERPRRHYRGHGVIAVNLLHHGFGVAACGAPRAGG
jgi:hypothetical protein